MACCSSCAEGHPVGCPEKTSADWGHPRPRLIRGQGPRLIRAADAQALGFVGPLLQMFSAINSARALGGEPCGSKYANLVQASGGRSKAAPYGSPGVWCNQVDAQAWLAQVKAVAGYVMTAARSLEPAKRPPSLASYFSTVEQLPQPSAWMAFGAGGCGDAVGQYIASIEQAACVLEQLDALGGAAIVPDLPPPPKSMTDQISAGISSVAIGAAVLMFALAAMKDKR